MTGLLVIDMQVGLFADGSRFDADGVVSNTDKLCTDYNPCTSDSAGSAAR